MNKTTRMRHRGPKEMQSLVDFYQRATGTILWICNIKGGKMGGLARLGNGLKWVILSTR